jgi:recombinational DNA repair protein (RecF pathway)
MKSIASFLLVLVVVSCAPAYNDITPAPVEDVEVKELPEDLEDLNEPEPNTVQKRAKKLMRLIFGGVNR